MRNSIVSVLIVFALVSFSCVPQQEELLEDKVNAIRQNCIADTRLEYWKVDVKKTNGESFIHGATVSASAFQQLKELAFTNNIRFEVTKLPTNEFEENSWAIVNLSVANIRRTASHASELLTQALMGVPVKVYKAEGSWYLVQTPDRYFGWVDAAAITLKTKDELRKWKVLTKVLYKNQNGFAYANAHTTASVECDLVASNLLSVVGEEKDYYQILLANGSRAWVKKEACMPLNTWRDKSFNIDGMLKSALHFKGVPYLWGGTSSKMLDCSGFTKSVYYMQGIILQRDASQQSLYGLPVDTEEDYSNLQKGDLVFFGSRREKDKPERVSHVGLCLNSHEFIHASGRVRISSLKQNSANYTAHYETAFVCARRIVGNVDGKGIEWVVDNEFYKMVLPE